MLVEHLRVFGCDAYTHIPKDERGKLDSKARKCILLGYGKETNGYRLYDPIRLKILHSRDVRFNEEKGDKAVTKSDEVRHVVLDFPCDSEPEPDDAPEPDMPPNQQSKDQQLRQRRPPDYYRVERSCLSIQSEPATFVEATTCPESSKRWSLR